MQLGWGENDALEGRSVCGWVLWLGARAGMARSGHAVLCAGKGATPLGRWHFCQLQLFEEQNDWRAPFSTFLSGTPLNSPVRQESVNALDAMLLMRQLYCGRWASKTLGWFSVATGCFLGVSAIKLPRKEAA